MDSGEPLFKVPGQTDVGVPIAGQTPGGAGPREHTNPPAGGPAGATTPSRRVGKRTAIAAASALAAVLLAGTLFVQFGRDTEKQIPTVGARPTTAAHSPQPEAVLSAQAVVVGTCDEGGSCGVKQRTAPYTDAPRLYSDDLQDGMAVTVVCQTTGDVRSSQGYGSSRMWYRINNGAYVNSVYLKVAAAVLPPC